MNSNVYAIALSLPSAAQLLFLIGMIIWLACAKCEVQRVKIVAMIGIACFLIAQVFGLLSPFLTRVVASGESIAIVFIVVRVVTSGLTCVGTFLLVYSALANRRMTQADVMPTSPVGLAESGNPYQPS